MKQVKLSIVIPAYNVEKYIGRCLDSLMNQDLEPSEFEIIVVDDGSTDGTYGLLQEYASRMPHLQVHHTENQGIGLARNHGCSKMQGQYFIFMDSDDALAPDCLGTIVQTMQEKALDMLVMNYRFCDENGEIPKVFDCTTRYPLDGRVLRGQDLMLLGLTPVIWMMAYSTSFWRRNDLHFRSCWHEDEELVPRAYFLAERVSYLPAEFYHYYKNAGSFMTAYKVESTYGMISAMESLNQFRAKYVTDKVMDAYFQKRISQKLWQGFRYSICSKFPMEEQKKYIRLVKDKKLKLLPRNKYLKRVLYGCSTYLFIVYFRFNLRGKHG